MEFKEDLPVPQGQRLLRRLNAEISDEAGQMEDQSLDLDARAMAILGKRQQFSVSSKIEGVREGRVLI